ncbi:hypothetical protein ASH02_24170 [Nocardioides sp. Soil796]|nr:hypothetical protein ASH02_24170 [Nocardioides sp. Soil796]
MDYTNQRLCLWIRVVLYATAHHGQPLEAGELRQALDPTVRSTDISRAIRTATRHGLLHPRSSARCLYLKDQRR